MLESNYDANRSDDYIRKSSILILREKMIWQCDLFDLYRVTRFIAIYFVLYPLNDEQCTFCIVSLQIWKQVEPVFIDGKKVYPCPICNIIIKRRDHLKRHCQTMHDIGTLPSFACPCGYTTKRKDVAQNHIKRCRYHAQ